MPVVLQITPCRRHAHHRHGDADQPPRKLNLLKECRERTSERADQLPREGIRRANQCHRAQRTECQSRAVLSVHRGFSLRIAANQQQRTADQQCQPRNHADGIREILRNIRVHIAREGDKEAARLKHVFLRIQNDARADAVARILHHRHIEPHTAKHRDRRRLQNGEEATLFAHQLGQAERRRDSAKQRTEQRAEQMAHAHARHAQCQQGPLSVVPAKHLIQRPDDEREEDHRQALAQRRARIQIDQPIDAQRIQHARADRRAAAVKDRLCAHIAAQRGKQVDAHLKHADACAERHAHISQNRRNIQEQLRIELRRGIAIAQQRGGMDAHGELPAAQTAGDTLDAVQVEQHIVSVKYAAPEQRHAGKRRRAKHHQRIPPAHAPPRTRIPAQNEQHRQHRAEQRRVCRQIG